MRGDHWYETANEWLIPLVIVLSSVGLGIALFALDARPAPANSAAAAASAGTAWLRRAHWAGSEPGWRGPGALGAAEDAGAPAIDDGGVDRWQ